MSRFKQRVVIFFVLVFIALLKWWHYSQRVEIIHRERIYSDAQKIILVWNKQDMWDFKKNSNQAFIDYRCQVTNCVFTDDRRKLKDAHAVVFHKDLKDKPRYKYTDQRWVFVSLESPCHINLEKEENLINWTQTYRKDSDIHMPYGVFYKKSTPIKIDFKEILKKKKKLAAWFVTHCHTHGNRRAYVKRLQKHIDIDIYGRCSNIYGVNNPCRHRQMCYNKLNTTYKFYLAFENSFHQDYATEKFWRMLKRFIVPVVRGGGNYSRLSLPKSFISTDEFNSPRELANYLLYLDQNDTAYIEYLKHLETHDFYDSRPMFRMLNDDYSFCKLCQKLNNRSEPKKSYFDVKKWFGKCKTPVDVRETVGIFRYFYEKIITAIRSYDIIESS